MKEENKKIIDKLTESCYKNKLSIELKGETFYGNFRFEPEQKKNNGIIPARVHINVYETENYNGYYDPSTEIHVYLAPLRPVYKENTRVFNFVNLDFFRGYNLSGKNVTVFTKRDLTDEEIMWFQGAQEFEIKKV
jgi:hypothetical protein